jgi:hypothetical protein
MPNVGDQGNRIKEVIGMPKRDNNAGLGTAGPHKQGETGGKGGNRKGGASSGGKKPTSQSNIKSGAYASGGQTPKEGISKMNESGKGSGNR